MKRMRLFSVLGLCAVLAVGASVPAQAARTAAGMTNATLLLDWYPNSDHGGIYAAIQQGFLAQRGVNLTAQVPSDTSSQVKLVAAGRADFGITYESDTLNSVAQGIPVQSVMCLVQHPLNTLMSLKSSHINRPSDLVGKTVGITGVPSDTTMVTAMLLYDHTSVSKVKFVNVGFNLLPALFSHKVDAIIGAYWNWEAVQASLKGIAVTTLRVQQWGVPNYCELVLIANNSTIKNRPALVRSTVQALQEGYAYAEAHPEVAWAALHNADKTLDHKLVITSLNLLRPAIVTGSTIGIHYGAQWQGYADWLAKNKLINKPVTASTAFTNAFLKPGVL